MLKQIWNTELDRGDYVFACILGALYCYWFADSALAVPIFQATAALTFKTAAYIGTRLAERHNRKLLDK